MSHQANLKLYTLVDRPVSGYVIEALGLQVGQRSHLVAIRPFARRAWKGEDKVTLAARAAKQMGANYFVMKFNLCYDEADDTVYVVVHMDELASDKRRYTYHIGDDTLCFKEVKSIVVQKNSHRTFTEILVPFKATRSNTTLDNEVVSLFVIENLELVPGDQSRLITAKGLASENKVKLVAHVVKENHGPSFVPKFKYALDGVSGTVYVLVLDAGDSELMAGRSFEVDGEHLSFFRVLKIQQLSEVDDPYQTSYCDKVWPPRAM